MAFVCRVNGWLQPLFRRLVCHGTGKVLSLFGFWVAIRGILLLAQNLFGILSGLLFIGASLGLGF